MQTNIPENPIVDLDSPENYLNRELSMLKFQYRVFEEAQDRSNPLLERLKFIAIVGSNMDEFFMVRIGGVKLQIEAGVVDVTPDGMTPAEQLAALRKQSHTLLVECQELLHSEILPPLRDEGIHILNYDELNDKQITSVESYFHEVIFPVLTPLAFDPGHPFPHISNLSLNLAIMLADRKGNKHFARLKVPGTLPRLIPIKRSSGSRRKDGTVPYNHYFVYIEQVIAANIQKLFPGMDILAVEPFHVTRNADMEIQELEADDLLETMEESVRRRRFGDVVRMSVHNTMTDDIRNILIANLQLDPKDIYSFDGPLAMSDFFSVYNSVERYELKDSPFLPARPSRLKGHDGDIFAAIRNGEILIHHPYDSFDPVVEFLRAAGRDKNVLAIKQTLYRVGKNSPVVKALLEARENGKQVAVLVELKARFDEESNIGWAKVLEREGVHVTYGLVGLKTHSKIALVVRKEGESIRRYIHLATGNYNAVTAHLYEDLGMFTTDPEIGEDATDLFNFLTGYSDKQDYNKLLVAPINLRQSLEAYVEAEIENAKKGERAHIIMKTNAVVDKRIIKLLYQASQAGVQIELFVRGICCLRPGVPGLSENISVVSILGRFLEHSRIYYFYNGGNEKIYLGSADAMPRNLDRRVEVTFPIENPKMIKHIRDNILGIYQRDNVRARVMNADGTYTRLTPKDGETPIDVQEWFLAERQG